MSGRSALLVFFTGVTASAVAVATFVYSAKTLGPIPVSVTQTTTAKQGTFDATGDVKLTVVPDNAQVSLGISATKAKVSDAQFEVNQIMTQLTDKLTALGIEKKDIRTENYSVNPEYDYSSGKPRTTGYRVNSTVRVDLKQFDKVNDVIDTATAAGITEVNGVQFTLSDEKEAELKKQARTEAIEKAKQNASELASLSGMKLGKIVNITENQNTPPILFNKAMNLAADSAGGLGGAPTQIEPGTQSYSYSVTISYETL